MPVCVCVCVCECECEHLAVPVCTPYAVRCAPGHTLSHAQLCDRVRGRVCTPRCAPGHGLGCKASLTHVGGPCAGGSTMCQGAQQSVGEHGQVLVSMVGCWGALPGVPHKTCWGAQTHLHRVHSMTHKSAVCQRHNYVSGHRRKTSGCRGRVQGLRGGQGTQDADDAVRPGDSGVSEWARDTGGAADAGSNLTPLHPQNSPNLTSLHPQSQRPPNAPAVPPTPLSTPHPQHPWLTQCPSVPIPNTPCAPHSLPNASQHIPMSPS